MRTCLLMSTFAWLVLVVPVAGAETVGEKIGQQIDKTVDELRGEAAEIAQQAREGFERVRASVERMSVRARVYARLHWDKSLQNASLSIEVDGQGVALLKGSVPSSEAKATAGKLANDTVGVLRVVNELQVEPNVSR
jgi:osmotically-inducible protein OsmY